MGVVIGGNVGTGNGVFRDKVGTVLNLKSLKAGSNITLTPSSDEILVEANTAEQSNNLVLVNSISDLPTPVGGIITLLDDTVYKISGTINIGGSRLVVGSNTTLRGNSPALDIITSTTTLSLINSSSNFRIFELGFQCNNGKIFNLTGDGSNICLQFGVRFFGTGGLGTVSGYDLFEITTGLFVGYSSKLTFSGTNGTLLLLDLTTVDLNGIITIDLDNATFSSIKISNCDFTIPANGVAIEALPNSGNIRSGGAGIISSTTFSLSGNAKSVNNYSPLDLGWSVGAENVGILPSDRILPQGWEFSVDSQSSPSTQSITTTPTKILIDGGDSQTNHSFLPKSIRGNSSLHLWKELTSTLTPIVVGDSYDLRIQVGFNNLVGNPTQLTLKLDIGSTQNGTGAGGSIIVATDTKPVKGATEPVIFSFPIFTLDTFIANGGSLWLQTDTGTAVINFRSILIARTSSEAS